MSEFFGVFLPQHIGVAAVIVVGVVAMAYFGVTAHLAALEEEREQDDAQARDDRPDSDVWPSVAHPFIPRARPESLRQAQARHEA